MTTEQIQQDWQQDGDARLARLNLRVPNWLAESLRKEAWDKGVPVSVLLREILLKHTGVAS